MWLIETGFSLLRHPAAHKARQPTEQYEALAKLKTIAVAIIQQALDQWHTCIPKHIEMNENEPPERIEQEIHVTQAPRP